MRTKNSRLLTEVHETAADMHRLGFIDKRKMREYAALCLPTIPDYGAAEVKALRERHRLSQAVLAAVLNTSLSTVRQWEIGKKHPGSSSLKLLHLLDSKGLEALM